MTGQHLFLFQIGPVQSFIAAARKTQDLYVGSHILSTLASAGAKSASECAGFQAVFPSKEDFEQDRSPHRFSFICEDRAETVAEKVRGTIEATWREQFALPVRRLLQSASVGGQWQEIFDRQAYNWLEIYWVAVEYGKPPHNETYKQAAIAMVQRKYARHFPQVDEPGRKCSLTGAQSALELDWNKLRSAIRDNNATVIRQNEYLGSLALIKRLAGVAREEEGDAIQGLRVRIPSTTQIAANDWNAPEDGYSNKDVAGYLAVLHMDGDQMGTRLSELADLGAHQRFSTTLAAFGALSKPDDKDPQTAHGIVRKFGGDTGLLIYAGGDDVLALLPLEFALDCAQRLQSRFNALTGCTASAGIAITPADLPLDRALELARAAEEEAKEEYGRNAVVAVEAHGTGQMRSAGAKWGVLPIVRDLQKWFAEDALSGKLGYDLLTVDQYLFGVELKSARAAEVERLARRRTHESADYDKVVSPTIRQMIGAVEEPGSGMTWRDMANWVILARFLSQKPQQKPQEAHK